MSVDFAKSQTAYETQQELIADFTDVLDMHIYYLYKYHSWVGPDSKLQNMMGLVVSRDEFEKNLLAASDLVAFSCADESELAEIEQTRRYMRKRLTATFESSADYPLINAMVNFTLSEFEIYVLLMMVCCEMNKKYEKLFSYLQDDITKKHPTVETAIRLFAEPRSFITEYFSYFSDDKALRGFLCKHDDNSLCSSRLELSKQAFEYLAGGGCEFDVFDPQSHIDPLFIDKNISDEMTGLIRLSDNKTALVFLRGKSGSGRRFHIKHCSKRLGKRVVFVSAVGLNDETELENRINSAICAAVLRNAALCITDFEFLISEDSRSLLNKLSRLLNSRQPFLGSALFIVSEKKWYETGLCGSIVKIDIEIPDTDEASRLILWENYLDGKELSDEVDPAETAAKFRFTPGQIRAAANRAVNIADISGESVVTSENLHRSCYDQVVIGLDMLASPIEPAYGWDDIILPQEDIQLLREACSHIKYQAKVYHEWGFGKKAAYGRGLSVLFSGPPGTGKTMAAQVITNHLHMTMYKIQLSQIISKYIGETEKNLRKVFTEAKNANCILFFDEMDALFGKRSEVKDSHDRNANVETAYLLQQMEEYDGVVLMATNLIQNIDEAFMRRIGFVIKFPFPDTPTRKMLWKKLLDTNAPMSDDIDFDFLAECFKMAGGNIKNCAVHAAFLAAAEGAPISMKHLVRSAVNEQRKNNSVVLREDLKEYADMIFGGKDSGEREPF